MFVVTLVHFVHVPIQLYVKSTFDIHIPAIVLFVAVAVCGDTTVADSILVYVHIKYSNRVMKCQDKGIVHHVSITLIFTLLSTLHLCTSHNARKLTLVYQLPVTS